MFHDDEFADHERWVHQLAVVFRRGESGLHIAAVSRGAVTTQIRAVGVESLRHICKFEGFRFDEGFRRTGNLRRSPTNEGFRWWDTSPEFHSRFSHLVADNRQPCC
jgi:hypothetical protein